MIAVIDNGAESVLKQLPEHTFELIIFIPAIYDLAVVERISRIGAKKMVRGGSLIVAPSLPAAIAAL